jgi:hypothetical protein
MDLLLPGRLKRGLAVASAAGLATGVMALTVSPASAAPPPPRVSIGSEIAHGAHASQPPLTSANSRSTRVCPAKIVVGRHSCFVLKRGGLHPIPASTSPDAIHHRDR